MTTTTIQSEYQFTAQITGKASTPNGTPYLQFNWKLPSSQYPFHLLLAKEPETFEAWQVGDTASVVVAQGGLKNGKNGQYATDYFWNLASIEAAWDYPNDETPPMGPPSQSTNYKSPTPQGSAVSGQPQPVSRGSEPKDAIQTRIDIGMAFNAAYTLLDRVFTGSAFTIEEMCQKVREYRDHLYHEVIQVPVAPPHYCYEHEQPRRRITAEWQGMEAGTWLHDAGTDWCTPGYLAVKVEEEPPPQKEADTHIQARQ